MLFNVEEPAPEDHLSAAKLGQQEKGGNACKPAVVDSRSCCCRALALLPVDNAFARQCGAAAKLALGLA